MNETQKELMKDPKNGYFNCEPLHMLGIKMLVNGEEIYAANNYKQNAREFSVVFFYNVTDWKTLEKTTRAEIVIDINGHQMKNTGELKKLILYKPSEWYSEAEAFFEIEDVWTNNGKQF